MATPSTTAVGYDECPLSNVLWMKFYNSHGKYKPELNEYFHMYRCQLNFALFCATSALGISWEHLTHPNLLVRSVYRFHVYFHVRLMLHDLGIPLPHEDGFSKVINAYINSAYYRICDAHGVNANETWMYGDWFYTTGCGIFGHNVKATKKSPPDNHTRWLITQSQGFTRNSIEKISRSVRAYIYLVLTSQVQARSSIVGNSTPAVDAPKSLRARSYDLKMLTEKYSDEKLAITFLNVGTGLIAYHFW